jgi:hypothetical protein
MPDSTRLIARFFRINPNLGAPVTPIDQAWHALQIQDLEIKFLCDALRDGSRFEARSSANDHELWRLRFFKESRFEIDIYVWMCPLPDDAQVDKFRDAQYTHVLQALGLKTRELVDVGRSIWQSSGDEDSVLKASMFMRGTRSLKLDEYESRSERQLAIDPRGLSLIAKQDHAGFIFRRYLVLQALLIAYQQSIEAASRDLSALVAAGGDAFEELEKLRRDCLIFEARYLFARPVRLDTVDLRFVWDELAQRQHLRDAHGEFNDQLSAIHGLLSDQEQRREAERDKRRERLITALGLVLTILSLLSLLSITPDVVRQFFRGWLGV